MEITLQEDVKELVDELNQIGNSVIFGGYLRDRMLNLHSSDVDIATNIPIEVVESKFSHLEKAQKRKTITGHDIYSFKLERREKTFFEIVCTNDDLSKKALEADYTINSLLHDGEKLIDYTHALDDFKEKIIKEVDINIIQNDLKERPYLWLKTLRLLSLTGFSLTNEVFRALDENKSVINSINPEIIQTEGHKILNGKNPFLTLHVLEKMNLLRSFNVHEQFTEGFLSIQPHQKLCLLAFLSSKEMIGDFLVLFHFQEKTIEKYEELYEALISEKRVPNRLKHQVIMLKKILKKQMNI